MRTGPTPARTHTSKLAQKRMDGSQYFGNLGAWTGAANPSTAGEWATTCENWTDTTEPVCYGGKAGFTDEWGFFLASSSRCSADWMHLYCLQE